MNCKSNKNQYRKINVRRQTAACKTSNFLEKYEIVFVLQSTMVTLQEWKMLQKDFTIGKKIGGLLVNSKLANKFVPFNETKTNTIDISREATGQNQCSDPALNQNFIINIHQANKLFSHSNKNLRKNINLFQAPTLLLGCDSQEQVSHIFESIINKRFFLLPCSSSSTMLFPWLRCKLRYLQYNRILLGGIYKSIKYSHLDFYQQNIINSTAYPNFRDSLQKKISLLLSLYFTFFQHKVYQQYQMNRF